MQKDLLTTIKTKFPRNGWALIKTTKIKPFGYIGYILTIYDTKDDTTELHDIIRGKNLRSILSQLEKLNVPF